MINRRRFLVHTAKGSAGLGLLIKLGCNGSKTNKSKGTESETRQQPEAPQVPSQPLETAWLEVKPDSSVVVQIPRCDMGQGTSSAIAALVAEELGADWRRVSTTFAPVDEVYGEIQTVSTSACLTVHMSWEVARVAGAVAREMLISAAAADWGVDRDACSASDSHIENKTTGAKLAFGSLVEKGLEALST